MSNSEVSALRELMEVKFAHLEQQIQQLRQAVERLAEGTVRAERFESALLKIRELERMIGSLDDRLNRAETNIQAYRYIGGLIVGVMVALVVAWLKDQLGI